MTALDIILLLLALTNIATIILVWRTHGLTVKIEHAANGMQAELVKAAKDAGFADGREVGRGENNGEKESGTSGIAS